MKVTYNGPDARVHIPGVGKFDAGVIEVPDDVGKALVSTHPHFTATKAEKPNTKKEETA